MMVSQSASCTKDRPCFYHSPCARCAALEALEEGDWQIISFYQKVFDQVVVCGEEVLPRLEGWEAALRIHRYPEESWAWLIAGATTLHRLFSKQDKVEWWAEFGKSVDQVTKEDVS